MGKGTRKGVGNFNLEGKKPEEAGWIALRR